MKKLMTLCIPERPGAVLLGMKKRGFGQGRWNGFGGKVHQGEAIEQAMLRELKEEAGIAPLKNEKRGVLTFIFEGQEDFFEVHVWSVNGFEGGPRESDEMVPRWFSTREIPFDEMWPDDRHWFPLFLNGKKFKGTFKFKDPSTLLDSKVEEV
jgi:8-oxo-dGTP pyrophosphatase MutT (NUDIX family)